MNTSFTDENYKILCDIYKQYWRIVLPSCAKTMRKQIKKSLQEYEKIELYLKDDFPNLDIDLKHRYNHWLAGLKKYYRSCLKNPHVSITPCGKFSGKTLSTNQLGFTLWDGDLGKRTLIGWRRACYDGGMDFTTFCYFDFIRKVRDS